MAEYAGREQEIEAREEVATKGPWENVRPGGIPPGIVCDIDGESWDITEDADFIAHAREDIPYLLAQLREAREEIGRLYKAVEAKEKQVAGQKRTLHKVKNKWDASMREGEQLAAALAHLLAWARPSASQQVEAEVETAIEELEKYREAHPRLDRILKGGD